MNSEELEKLLEKVRDSTKLAILRKLCEVDEASLDDLAEATGKHRTTVFRHLAHLCSLGLVEYRTCDHRKFYRIPDKYREVLKELLRREVPEFRDIEVSKYPLLYRFKLKILPILVVLPPIILAAIGVAGFLVPRPVSFLARVLWLTIFLLLAYLTFKITKKLL